MKEKLKLTPENFEALLDWLSPDREEAGRKYEDIRKGLIRFFNFRGCSDSEMLTDETITRVAAKVTTFDNEGAVKTITYFYGFAANIYREHLAKRAKREVQLEDNSYLDLKAPTEVKNEKHMLLDCLEDCLATLSANESELMVSYYSKEKKEKAELRNALARRMNLNVNSLYIKVHRIKLVLRECVDNCRKERTV